MFSTLLVLVLCASNPLDDWPPPVVADIVEINTSYYVTWNEEKQKYYVQKGIEQTIGWKLDANGVMHVDWWVSGHYEPICYNRGYYVFLVKRNNVYHRVLARHIIRRATLGDPERIDADVYPMDKRAGLEPWLHLNILSRSLKGGN